MAFDPVETLRGERVDNAPVGGPLSGTRQQRIQRLQVGLSGLGAVVLLVGLANIVMNTAQQNQVVVAEESPVTPTRDVPPPAGRDPLADAGVVPAMPAETGTTAAGVAQSPAPAGAPAQEAGNAAPPPRQ